MSVIIASSNLNVEGKGSSESKSTNWLRILEHTWPGARKASIASGLTSTNFALPSLNSLPTCGYLSYKILLRSFKNALEFVFWREAKHVPKQLLAPQVDAVVMVVLSCCCYCKVLIRTL